MKNTKPKNRKPRIKRTTTGYGLKKIVLNEIGIQNTIFDDLEQTFNNRG